MRRLALIGFVFLSYLLSSQTAVFSVSIETTPAACYKGSVKLNISGGTGPVTVNWNTGAQGYYITGLDSGYYDAVIIDSAGADTAFTIYIEPQVCGIVGAPSFSPNGDNINDTWFVNNIGYYEGYVLQIFNRYGQKIYESNSEYEGWDGKANGLAAPDGTYFYIVEYNDKYFGKQVGKGSITLMR